MTCGPTWVAIDKVRVISNTSSGELGHLIADALHKEGAKVTLLEGPVTHILKTKPSRLIKFFFYDEFSKLLQVEAKNNYDVIIHAAAVSDYRASNTYGSKLSSEFSQLRINLIPTEKLIDKIKKIAPQTFLVGFKLEADVEKEQLILKAAHLIKKTGCDLAVANCKGDHYCGFIINAKKEILAEHATKKEIAKSLITLLKERL